MTGSTEDSTDTGSVWQAEIPAGSESAKPVDLTHDLKDLDAEQRDTRRKVLMDMLASSVARYQSALRNRRPDMAVGQRLVVIGGKLIGRHGVVLDADFIHNRVQLDVDDMNEPQWVLFNHVRGISV